MSLALEGSRYRRPGLLLIDMVVSLHTAWIIFLYATWPFCLVSERYTIIFFAVAVLTLFARAVYGGDCVLTNWENNLRKRYEPDTWYNDRCIPYYSQKWFGYRIPKLAIGLAYGFVFLFSLTILIKNLL